MHVYICFCYFTLSKQKKITISPVGISKQLLTFAFKVNMYTVTNTGTSCKDISQLNLQAMKMVMFSSFNFSLELIFRRFG